MSFLLSRFLHRSRRARVLTGSIAGSATLLVSLLCACLPMEAQMPHTAPTMHVAPAPEQSAAADVHTHCTPPASEQQAPQHDTHTPACPHCAQPQLTQSQVVAPVAAIIVHYAGHYLPAVIPAVPHTAIPVSAITDERQRPWRSRPLAFSPCPPLAQHCVLII